jgi:hypothetical protein
MSYSWWEGFRKRHPDIVLRKPEPLSHTRLNCTQPAVLVRYFELLGHTLDKSNLHHHPSQIFNMEDTGVPLAPKAPFIVSYRGAKHPSCTSGNKGQITVLSCCSASGYCIPPFVIFDRKTLSPALTYGEVPGTMYGLSQSGWINSDLFQLWFQNHFLAHVPSARPLLLIMDGHSSPYNLDCIRMAAEENVVLFCPPPNTTHKTQPLDKGCFAPLKSYWRAACHKYMKDNTQHHFSELFAQAWMKGMTMTNIISGFKTTGIYPFNPQALLPPDKPIANSPIFKQTSLSFIPLISPFPKRYESHKVTDESFTDDKIARYKRRVEEGYDLFDERYENWKRSNAWKMFE